MHRDINSIVVGPLPSLQDSVARPSFEPVKCSVHCHISFLYEPPFHIHFSVLKSYQMICPNQRPHVSFCNMLVLYRKGLLAFSKPQRHVHL